MVVSAGKFTSSLARRNQELDPPTTLRLIPIEMIDPGSSEERGVLSRSMGGNQENSSAHEVAFDNEFHSSIDDGASSISSRWQPLQELEYIRDLPTISEHLSH